MRSSGNASVNGHRTTAPTSTSPSGSGNSGNSGSQYALCALGVGLVALGIVMIVWSVVPADPTANTSLSAGGDPDPGGRKQKASSVAFVLVGIGVAVLLLSMCLGMRNKQREQQYLQQQQQQQQQQQRAGPGDAHTAEEQARRFAVPTYEEVVGSGQYPVVPQSVSQLPSYDDLQYESEGAAAAVEPPPTAAAARRPGRSKLLPLKIRRIKSEKLHMKDGNVPPAPAHISIEPLTPPPQYDDRLPPPPQYDNRLPPL